jgi:hypothetical protein
MIHYAQEVIFAHMKLEMAYITRNTWRPCFPMTLMKYRRWRLKQVLLALILWRQAVPASPMSRQSKSTVVSLLDIV